MIAGWDATVYVNEEVKHRRQNPGRAAVIAVAMLVVIYTFCQLGLQGVVSPAKLQANSSSVLVYIAQALGGGGWAKVMALALALSVIASTGVSIVILARMLYGMASHRVLPDDPGQREHSLRHARRRQHRRRRDPRRDHLGVPAVQFDRERLHRADRRQRRAVRQLLPLTALSAIAYYRRRIFSNAWDAVLIGILPLAAAAFLVWIVFKSWQNEPASQRWSLIGVVVAGVILMLIARFVLRSQFFHIERESAAR